MIHRNFTGQYDTLEFGSSMGIVTSHLASKMLNGRKIVGVEANPNLMQVLSANVMAHKQEKVDFIPVNKAIGYKSQSVRLEITSNTTETKVSRNDGIEARGLVVQTTTLSDLVQEFGIGEFSLICDIEGTELELLQMDAPAFTNCKEFIVELHTVSEGGYSWSIADLVNLIERQTGMILRDKDGPVAYFGR